MKTNGTTVPPMLIFPYKKMPKVIVESVPSNWGLGRSDSGWMNSEVFYEYISNHFLPYLKSAKIVRPVILFVDGHRSHMTKQVSELCDQNGIILISLFPNTTHITQPADVAVFKPLKSGWTSTVRTWKFENFPKDVTRFTFGLILSSVFDKYATAKTIENGFRKCGLFPFNKNNVDYTKCIPNRKPELPNVVDTIENHDKLGRYVLSKIEEKIEKPELIQFLQTYSNKTEWSGNPESLNLYKVWFDLKTETEKNTLPENDVIQNVDEVGKNRMDDLIETNVSENEGAASEIHNVGHVSPEPYNSAGPSWYTPENANNQFYEKKEAEGFKVPTPFKKCLVFPKTPEKQTPKRKRQIFPAVVSSGKYREFYEKQLHTNKKSISKLKKKKERKVTPLIATEMAASSSSESDVEISYDDEDLDLSETENLDLAVGKYVVVKYEDEYYPGLIQKRDDEGAEIKSMKKAGLDWKWPSKPDILYYFNEDIIRIISEPQLKNSRGLFSVPEMSKYWS